MAMVFILHHNVTHSHAPGFSRMACNDDRAHVGTLHNFERTARAASRPLPRMATFHRDFLLKHVATVSLKLLLLRAVVSSRRSVLTALLPIRLFCRGMDALCSTFAVRSGMCCSAHERTGPKAL